MRKTSRKLAASFKISVNRGDFTMYSGILYEKHRASHHFDPSVPLSLCCGKPRCTLFSLRAYRHNWRVWQHITSLWWHCVNRMRGNARKGMRFCCYHSDFCLFFIFVFSLSFCQQRFKMKATLWSFMDSCAKLCFFEDQGKCYSMKATTKWGAKNYWRWRIFMKGYNEAAVTDSIWIRVDDANLVSETNTLLRS